MNAKALAALAALSLAGCATSAAKMSIGNVGDWSGAVQPKDAAPYECKIAPPACPKLDPSKAYTAKESAREMRRLTVCERELRRRYKRCRVWAQGQR